MKSPVYGEVVEVNPRLEREPCLVTFAPLSEGWLVRLAISRVPQYLRRSRTISRAEVASFLADRAKLGEFVMSRLGRAESSIGRDLVDVSHEDMPRELRFDGLRSDERAELHRAAEEVGFETQSRGRGPGRQLIVRRAADADENAEDDEAGDETANGTGDEDEEDRREHDNAGMRRRSSLHDGRTSATRTRARGRGARRAISEDEAWREDMSG